MEDGFLRPGLFSQSCTMLEAWNEPILRYQGGRCADLVFHAIIEDVYRIVSAIVYFSLADRAHRHHIRL